MTATTQGTRFAPPSVSPAPTDDLEGRSSHLLRRLLLLVGAVIGGWFLISALQTTHAAAATGLPAPAAPTSARGHTLTTAITDVATPAVTTAHKAAASVADTADRSVAGAHAAVRHTVAHLRSVHPAARVHRIAQLVKITPPVKITPRTRGVAQHLLHPTKVGSTATRSNQSAPLNESPAQRRTVSGASRPVAITLATGSPRFISSSTVPAAPLATAVRQPTQRSTAASRTATPGAPAPSPAPMPAPAGGVATAGSSSPGGDRGLSLAAIDVFAPHSVDLRSVRLAAAASADLPTIADKPSVSPD